MSTPGNELRNFRDCAEHAPDGTHQLAKSVNDLIGDTCDQLIRDLRALGLSADNCDGAFRLEVALYQYIKESNTAHPLFPVSEGFGDALSGPARERVLAGAVGDLNAHQQVGISH